jgi:hypothetical protein
MCVGLAASYFPIVTSCKPNAQVLGFNTDCYRALQQCSIWSRFGNVLCPLSAKRKHNRVATGMSTCFTSKSLNVFRVWTDPRGRAVLRRGSAAANLLRLRVRIPSGNGCLCLACVGLSDNGLCIGLITRPEQSYRVWCVWDRETMKTRRHWPTRGCCGRGKKIRVHYHIEICNRIWY